MLKDQFDSLVSDMTFQKKRLNQHLPEFLAYLEYTKAYFDFCGVTRPVVVEVGILDGAQRIFYEQLLNAEYISIDIDPKAPATIHGDSSALSTVQEVVRMLGGRPIDLCFIDGLHTYEGAKADLNAYYPLTRHIVALHDILTPKLHPHDPVDVIRLWREILAGNKHDTLLTIQHFNPRDPREFNGRPLGIGVVVKRRS